MWNLLKTIQSNESSTETKHLIQIALPLAFAQLFHVGMGAIDTYFLAQIGPAELAGAGLAVQCFTLISVFMSGLLSITGVQRAYYVGRGEIKQAEQTVSDALGLAGLLAIAYSVLLICFPYTLGFLGQPAIAIQNATAYAAPLTLCTLPILFWITMRYIYSAEMRTTYLIWTNLAGFSAKYLGNLWIAPQYGIKGIAWVSVFSYWLMAALALSFMLPFRFHLPQFSAIKNFFRVGLPVACSGISDTGFFAVLILISGNLGVETLSSHYLALQFLYLPYIIPYAMNIAVSVRVAYFLGKRKPDLISNVIELALNIALVPICIISCAYFIYPAEHLPFLWLVGIFQIFNAIQAILMGSLRGMKETKFPFLLSLCSYWVLGIPLCYSFAGMFGLKGIWTGMIAIPCLLSVLLKIYLNKKIEEANLIKEF